MESLTASCLLSSHSLEKSMTFSVGYTVTTKIFSNKITIMFQSSGLFRVCKSCAEIRDNAPCDPASCHVEI